MKRLSLFLAAVFSISFLCVLGCTGQVTNTLPNGAKYIGEWKNGKPEGRGTLISPYGVQNYAGEFKDGKENGQGKLTLSDGGKYEGEFKNDMPEGHGSLSFADGSRYVGGFHDGQPNGQGTLSVPGGTIQQGEWRDGKNYRTTGTLIGPDRTKEVGTWNFDGTKCGGTIAWTDGRGYSGDWKVFKDSGELPDGAGTMTWPDGRKYVGQFHDGKMDGAGKMTYPGRKVEEGLWKQGVFVGALP